MRVCNLVLALAAVVTATFTCQGTANAGTVELWLKADAGVLNGGGTAAANGDYVGTWSDQSAGVGGDAVQATAAYRPTYATSVLNGMPVIRFAGTRATSSTQDFLDSAFTTAVGQQYTIFLAGKSNGNTDSTTKATDYFYDGGPNGGSRVVFSLNPTGTNENQLTSYAGTGGVSPAWTRAQWTQYHVYESVFNGANSALLIDGTSLATGNAGANGISTQGLRIGVQNNSTQHGLNGDIAEMIVLSNANGAERAITGNYLGAKYGIARTDRNVYSGDSAAKGDYDFDVVGVGKESDGGVATSGSSKGLVLNAVLSGLDNGEYLLAGQKLTTNSWTTANDPTGIAHRSSRVWYVDKTGSFDANLTFDLSDAGLSFDAAKTYKLLYGSSDTAFSVLSLTGVVVGDAITFGVGNANLASGYFTLGEAVPEPGTVVLLATALVSLLCYAWRRRR
jgi:hypothetical protein